MPIIISAKPVITAIHGIKLFMNCPTKITLKPAVRKTVKNPALAIKPKIIPFTINIPKQTISYAISGGGKQMHYITETELKNSNTIEINSEAFTTPRNAQQLQENYNRLETEGLDIIIS